MVSSLLSNSSSLKVSTNTTTYTAADIDNRKAAAYRTLLLDSQGIIMKLYYQLYILT